MKIAIMQPYFFPYIGYFQLINAADRFILFDDVQYIRHGWINRNRILKPTDEGSAYIIVPLVKHPNKTLIKDIKVTPDESWKEKILRQLDHYKKKSPYYSCVYKLLMDCFALNETSITKLNGHCLKAACEYIGINFNIEISSEMDLDYSNVNDAGEWALRICEQLGGSEYINPLGGRELFDNDKFAKSNLKLSFLQTEITTYNQYRANFEPSLSIIDVMMFNSPANIKTMLGNYQLV